MANRDIVNHGNGKGDAPRHTVDDNWRENYAAINWGRKPRKSGPRKSGPRKSPRKPGVVQTAAGPACKKCGRGRGVWLAQDESPCQC